MLQTSWIQTPGANTLVGFLPLSGGGFIHRPALPETPSGQQLDVYPCQGSNHTFCEVQQRPSGQADGLTGQVGCSANTWVRWVNPPKAPQPESGEWRPPKGKQRHWHLLSLVQSSTIYYESGHRNSSECESVDFSLHVESIKQFVYLLITGLK